MQLGKVRVAQQLVNRGKYLTAEHVETASDHLRRELEEVAEGSGWKVVKVYEDVRTPGQVANIEEIRDILTGSRGESRSEYATSPKSAKARKAIRKLAAPSLSLTPRSPEHLSNHPKGRSTPHVLKMIREGRLDVGIRSRRGVHLAASQSLHNRSISASDSLMSPSARHFFFEVDPVRCPVRPVRPSAYRYGEKNVPDDVQLKETKSETSCLEK